MSNKAGICIFGAGVMWALGFISMFTAENEMTSSNAFLVAIFYLLLAIYERMKP